MDKIQDLRSFEESIYFAIEEYINEEETYSLDAFLQINEQTKEISIGLSSTSDVVKEIPLSTLVMSNDGVDEIDCDAINELASTYIFVR